MSFTSPDLNPSQTIEKIREVIVGRNLERLEGRVARLESPPTIAANKSAPLGDIFEDRLLITEARLEALQDHVQRIEGKRDETEHIEAMHREEVQRLAMQISEIAREKAAIPVVSANENLERKFGSWLVGWQKSVHLRLEARDRELVDKVRIELTAMREGIEKRLTTIESRVPMNVEDRFSRIAAAARALAEGAAPTISTTISPIQ